MAINWHERYVGSCERRTFYREEQNNLLTPRVTSL
jgi:hypothetical protein